MKTRTWKTINGLATLLRADRRTIARITTNLPHQTIGGRKCWCVEDVRTLLEGDRSTRTASKALRDEMLREQIRRVRIANDKAAGLLTPTAVYVEQVTRVCTQAKGLLRQKLEYECPAYLANQDPAQVRVLLKRVVDDICARMAELGDGFTI